LNVSKYNQHFKFWDTARCFNITQLQKKLVCDCVFSDSVFTVTTEPIAPESCPTTACYNLLIYFHQLGSGNNTKLLTLLLQKNYIEFLREYSHD
jgi:hypothetical protein